MKRLATPTTLLFSALLLSAHDAQASTPAVTVKRLVFARGLVNRIPQGALSSELMGKEAKLCLVDDRDARCPDIAGPVAADGRRLYGYLELADNPAKQKLKVIWQRNGKTYANYSLAVRKSKHWRTWSYITLKAGMRGIWKVSVVDQAGQTLAERKVVVADY